MKFSEQWLREWINPALDTRALTEQMAMLGLTVDDVKPVAAAFSNVVVGEIVARVQHPNADKLSCCEVNVGEKALLKIVCGAPNARAGIKVAVAKVGAVLPGDFHIKEAKLRGELSQGMLCSAKELQLYLGKYEQDGIIELPSDAVIGDDFNAYFKSHDHVIDVDITPNRGDALSIRGLARDIAAALQIPPVATQPTPFSKGGSASHTDVAATETASLAIEIENPAACPRYVGRIIRGVNNTVQTPSFIQHALQRANVRLISPIVDVTNFVMLELGQPMHAYDLSTIKGGITVRAAVTSNINSAIRSTHAAERSECVLKLLDEQTITLTEHDLIIADDEKPLALAGIMGGMDSGVSNNTTDILLEAAFFTPKNICLSKRRHNTSSDSSHRFERGVDFNLCVEAMERATQLILSITGGNPGAVLDVKSDDHLPTRKSIFLARNQIERIIGIAIADSDVERILKSLEMTVKPVQNGWDVTPPSFRFDMTLPIDIIEELARMRGYQNIPAKDMVATLTMHPKNEARMCDKTVRRFFVDRAYHEAITYSFISSELHTLFAPHVAPMTLKNPLSQEMSVMRTSLLPGLLEAVKRNLHNQQERVRFFEMGMCFEGGIGDQGSEISELRQVNKLAFLMTGHVYPEQWGEKSRFVDFYDLKADMMALIADAQAHTHTLTFLHPGKSCAVYKNNTQIGFLGEVHPHILDHFDIKQAVVVCELDLHAVQAGEVPHFEVFSRFPAVRRDLALLVKESVGAAAIEAVITKKAGETLQDLRIFDVYQGKNIETGKKSIALGLTFRHPSRTLRDDEINEVIHGVIVELERELDATLRA